VLCSRKLPVSLAASSGVKSRRTQSEAVGEELLLDRDEEPLLDVDEEPPLDADEGLLLGELHDEGLEEGNELDAGAEAPPHGATGSPTFPSPALASASLAAASKAC